MNNKTNGNFNKRNSCFSSTVKYNLCCQFNWLNQIFVRFSAVKKNDIVIFNLLFPNVFSIKIQEFSFERKFIPTNFWEEK